MKVIFKKLEITNFRGIKDLTINFEDGVTNITGENGVGKTTTLSAITWCLFGKDINDNSSFVISPIENEIEKNDLETVVKLTTDSYVIERTYKDRKTTVRSGYILDGEEVLREITQTQLREEMSEELVDEELFKSLSNINYIPSLHWTDLKELFYELIGDVSLESVLVQDDFELIEDTLKKFGINEANNIIKKKLKDGVKKLKDLENEHKALVKLKDKYVGKDNDVEDLKQQEQDLIKEIELVKQERERNVAMLQDKVDLEKEYNFAKEQLSAKQELLENTKYMVDASLEQLEDGERSYIRSQEDKIRELERNNASLLKEIEEQETEAKELKTQGEQEKVRVIRIENDVCECCGQKLPEDKLQEHLEKLKQTQKDNLYRIKYLYDEQKSLTKFNEIEIKENNEEILKIKEDLSQFILGVQDGKKIKNPKQEELRKKYNELEKEVLKLETSLKGIYKRFKEQSDMVATITLPITLDTKLGGLNSQLDGVRANLVENNSITGILEDIVKIEDDIRIQKELNVKSSERVKQLSKFNSIRADLLNKKMAEHFDFARIKTRDITLDGIENETFKIVNTDGVEFKDINTGHKILLGIDLLQGIMKIKDIYVPILIDNTEVLSNNLDVKDTQLIITKVVKNTEGIVIENE